ncbi:nazgul [Carabus blaptoides fortunei]
MSVRQFADMEFNNLTESWWPIIVAGIIGILTFIRSYVAGQDCPCDNRIKNKTVLITGASSGLGFQTAKELAKRGGKIILTCRNIEKGTVAKNLIKHEVPTACIDVRHLDVSNIANVKHFVSNLNNYNTIDILINNAGIMFHPYEITPEGFETHLVTNYLGHFVLTHLLLPKLKASENGRVINITAAAYSSGYVNLNDLNLKNAGVKNIIQAFTQSKLALVLMSRYMAKLLKGSRVTINSVNPGLVRNTNHMNRSPLKTSIPVQLSVWPWMWLFLKTPKQGCQTIIYTAVDPSLTPISGKYYSNCEAKELSENCQDEQVDEQLYKLSCSLTKIQPLIN